MMLTNVSKYFNQDFSRVLEMRRNASFGFGLKIRDTLLLNIKISRITKKELHGPSQSWTPMKISQSIQTQFYIASVALLCCDVLK